MTQVPIQVISAETFAAIVRATENRDRLLELVHGEVVEKMPTEEYGKLAALIAHFLLAFILPRGIKAHVGVEVRHEAPDDRYNSRMPDVSVRLTDTPAVKAGVVAQMPDLAVEIQSPDDRPHQMRQKALYYLQKGTRLVWLVYPPAQRVEVCTLDESGNLAIATVVHEEMLDGGAVLPEFTLSVRHLFDQV
jgi:Uma2 family endonuclease